MVVPRLRLFSMIALAVLGVVSCGLVLRSRAFGPEGGLPLQSVAQVVEQVRAAFTSVTTPVPLRDTAADVGKRTGDYCITGVGVPFQCFATEAEALRMASNGHIQLAANDTSSSMGDEQLFTHTVRAVFYTEPNHAGHTLIVVSPTCDAWDNVPPAWNDQISSIRVGTACSITIYEHPNALTHGTTMWTIETPGQTDLGILNNHTSSWSIP